MTIHSIADDVTITWKLWREHVKSDISLDIDFIHGHIHGWLCLCLLFNNIVKYGVITNTLFKS